MSQERPGTVEFQSVTKRYGSVVAVRSVSFRIEPGTLVTLLGPSGCGKTTTLRMIAGLELASEGRILIGGKDVTSLPATDRNVSMVFQSYALFPHMRVLENVAYGLVVSGKPKGEAEKAAREGLALVGLEGYGDRLPSELSGGQQQRVAVARALVLEPEVLLFDEPLSNLDAKLRRKMREDIRALQQRLGLTAVYVTHDQEEALSVSDKIVVMNHAVIVQEGSPAELYDAPRSTFVASFIGEANLVDGELKEKQDGLAVVDLAGYQIRLPHRDRTPGPVKVSVRPHAVALAARTESREPAGVAGVVEKSTYLGSHMEYSIETPVGSLFVRGRVSEAFSPGAEVWVTLLEDGVALIAED